MKQSSKSFDLVGKNLTLETGILAQQATSSVLARLGDTMVLVTVVMGKDKPELGYFPLGVEYMERLYAGGKIKGSRWVKREGKPSDDAILKARLIDRSIRPLFPKQFTREVQVVVTVLSVDGENDPDILAIIATSAALSISKIPWNGPIGAVRVGLAQQTEENKNPELTINPNSSEFDLLDLDMVVTSNKDKVLMIEAGAKQVKEDVAIQAIKKAKECNQKIIDAILEMVKEVGEEKVKATKDVKLEEMVMLVEKSYKDEIHKLIEDGLSKENLGEDLDAIANRIYEKESENVESSKKIKEAVDYIFKRTVRERIINEGKRPDGRAENEIRPISGRVGILPRTHGSAIFQRGETQVLSITTLGPSSLEQLIESPEGEETKRYMHHYSMPPYSVGEAGRVGFPSRREIGHGALAERAIFSVIPSESKFPYAIRVVSEVMSSNGSTSMASTCGSALSLMDAGVPITDMVAGLAIGLMSSEKKYVLLTDIIGLEDFSGDMDFKVAGTKNGITAIQLDVKIDGLTDEIIEKTFERARDGRLFILDKMISVISESREGVSKFAPKIKVVKIVPEKIGEVIGSGGKVIRNIIATTGAMVDVDDEGNVTISSVNEEAVEKAAEWVGILTREIQKGEEFEGKVKRLLPFGAMVELVPGKEGLVHVSEMATEYVKDPGDIVKIGQVVKVRVKEIDDQGRTNLSMLFGADAEKKREERQGQRPQRSPFRQEEGRERRPFQRDRGFSRRRS